MLLMLRRYAPPYADAICCLYMLRRRYGYADAISLICFFFQRYAADSPYTMPRLRAAAFSPLRCYATTLLICC